MSSLAALPFEAGHDGGDRAAPFARTSPREKAALLRALLPRVLALAPEMVALACEAAGVAPASPLAGAAWLSGPVALLASIRSLAGALDDIATGGRPSLPATHLRGHLAGRLVARLEPRTFAERSLHRDAEAIAIFAAGIEPEDVISGQGAFYRQAEPPGGMAWIRDEGGPLSAAPLRVLDALFIEGKVATLATSPARPWLGPLVERAFAPLLEAGFLRVTVDHGGDEPSAPRAGEGGGPVIVLPAYYALDELRFVTRRLASAIAAGAAFDLAAPRILVVGGHWAQRELFLEHVQRALAALPSPWQLATDLTDGAAPPAGAIGVVTAGGDEPIAMLAAAVDLCNARPTGTTAEIVTHVLHDDDPRNRRRHRARGRRAPSRQGGHQPVAGGAGVPRRRLVGRAPRRAHAGARGQGRGARPAAHATAAGLFPRQPRRGAARREARPVPGGAQPPRAAVGRARLSSKGSGTGTSRAYRTATARG